MTAVLTAERPVIAPSQPVPEPEIATPADYKDAVARLPGGVAIVACEAEDGPHGRLVGSFTSLSADPPRALVCVGKGSLTHDRLLAAARVSVSVIAEDDAAETHIFSRVDRRHERFGPDRWTRHAGEEPPTYDRALATFIADVQHRLDFESHTMLILSIRQASHRAGRPLVTFDRGLFQLGEA